MKKSLLTLVLLATACAAPAAVDELSTVDAGLVEDDEKRPGGNPVFRTSRTDVYSASMTLVMTVNGGPAVEATNRTIKICRERTCKSLVGRSSATIWVKPGNYRVTMSATISSTRVTRERSVTTTESSRVIFAMD